MTSRALILDANSLIVRCIMASALDDLKANGLWTGGIYGSLRSLRSIASMPEIPVDRIVAFFDHGVPARRRALIPTYKQERAERREMLSPEDREKAFTQIAKCYTLFGHLGIRCLSFVDREADDGVAAAVRTLAAQGVESLVVSSDADLLQTVAMGASVHDLSDGKLTTAENFQDVVGVHPRLYTLYRTLTGDQSDSIKGAYGCGPKRATALLQDFLAADENEFPPPVTDLPVEQQLDELCVFLRRKGRQGAEPTDTDLVLKAWEAQILSDAPRLRKVAQGIDLSASFGGTTKLAARMDDLPPVAERAFLQACKQLNMRSVLGDPEGYLRPFRAIQQRRLGKTA